MPIVEYYELLADADGTMRSHDAPFGVGVRTEEEAKRFVLEGKVGYSHSYRKVVVYGGIAEYLASNQPPNNGHVNGMVLVDDFETGVQFVFQQPKE